MQAIVMAAGRGSRLGNLTDDRPKAFLEVKDIKLIEYNLALLDSLGVRDIVLVTGYRAEMFENLVAAMPNVHCVYNPFFGIMNVLGSFFMGQEHLVEDDLVYMHADTLCAPGVIRDMMAADADIVLPVDFGPCDEEAMKVRLVDGEIATISKGIPVDEAAGEFIGICKIAANAIEPLKKSARKLLGEGHFDYYFEGALQDLIDEGSCSAVCVDTAGRFWGEVDFLEDYRRVEGGLPDDLYSIASEFLRAGAGASLAPEQRPSL